MSTLTFSVTPCSISCTDSARLPLAFFGVSNVMSRWAKEFLNPLDWWSTKQMFSVVLPSGVVQSIVPNARQAPPSTTVESHVIWGKHVPTTTHQPASPRSSAPSGVLSGSYRLKMLWVDTPSVPTQVVDVESPWKNLSGMEEIGKPVSRNTLSLQVEPSVSTVVKVPLPLPAVVSLLDICPESVFGSGLGDTQRTTSTFECGLVDKAPVISIYGNRWAPPDFAANCGLGHTPIIPRRSKNG